MLPSTPSPCHIHPVILTPNPKLPKSVQFSPTPSTALISATHLQPGGPQHSASLPCPLLPLISKTDPCFSVNGSRGYVDTPGALTPSLFTCHMLPNSSRCQSQRPSGTLICGALCCVPRGCRPKGYGTLTARHLYHESNKENKGAPLPTQNPVSAQPSPPPWPRPHGSAFSCMAKSSPTDGGKAMRSETTRV